MGFMQILKKMGEKKSHGVCVPEAYRKRQKLMVEEETISSPGAFRISGILSVKNLLMLEGHMVQGTLVVGTEIEINGKKLHVSDVSVERKPTERINEGQRGALFLRAKAFPIIKNGDLLQF